MTGAEGWFMAANSPSGGLAKSSHFLDRFNSPRAVSAAAVILAALALISTAWPIWRALFPLEVDVDEPWNAYHADAVLFARPLYPTPDSLIVNNYPPLSFYLLAAFSAAGIDAIYAGRAFSLLGTAISGVAVGVCVRQMGGTRLAAVVAGFWFLATMVRFFEEYIGKNDPQLPALAMTLVALAWFLRRQARGRAVEPAILLMAVAGFYKHNLIATPVAALLWLATKDRRLAIRAALVGAAFVVAGLSLCILVYSEAFLHQLMYVREHSLWLALRNLGQLQFIAPAVVIWAGWAWYDRRSDAARFSALFVAAGLVAYVLQKLGMQIGVNAQFELTAATAIGLGLAFSHIMATPYAQRWGADATRLLILGVVIARLLLSNHVEAYLVLTSPDYRRLFAENSKVMAQEVERVRNIPGFVDCYWIRTVCRQAGKPFVYDRFAYEQRISTGRVTAAEVAAKLAAAGIRVEPVDARASARSLHRRLFAQIR